MNSMENNSNYKTIPFPIFLKFVGIQMDPSLQLQDAHDNRWRESERGREKAASSPSFFVTRPNKASLSLPLSLFLSLLALVWASLLCSFGCRRTRADSFNATQLDISQTFYVKTLIFLDGFMSSL